MSWTPILSRVYDSTSVGCIKAFHTRSQLSSLDTILLERLVKRNMRHAIIDSLTVGFGGGVVVVAVAVSVLVEGLRVVEVLVAGSRSAVVMAAGNRGAEVLAVSSTGVEVLVVGCRGVEVIVARFAELKEVGRGGVVLSS